MSSAGSAFAGCLPRLAGVMVLAIRREDTVEAGEIDSWLGRQSEMLGNKVQRFKDDMGGAVRVRGFSSYRTCPWAVITRRFSEMAGWLT